jgi:glycerophosphoryl diester phosphodiesterase
VLESWLTSRPVAHRGLYDLAAGRPENSLAAFAAGAAAGYPCELDVHLTGSGDLVVLHDFDLGRATGVARPVATLTAADLPGIRLFGSDQHLPALAQVTECVAGRVPLLLELKRRGSADPRALVNSVLRHLETSDGEYALSSFDPVLVYFLRRAKAGYPRGQISGLLRTAGPVKRLIGRSLIGNVLTRPDFMSYELAGLPSLIVSAWRRRGVPVLAWPVRSAADELQARKYADNIIFSDFRPEKLMRRKCPVLLALCYSPIPAPGPRPASWRSITSAGGSGYPRMRRTPWPGRSTWAGSPATSRPRPACCPG